MLVLSLQQCPLMAVHAPFTSVYDQYHVRSREAFVNFGGASRHALTELPLTSEVMPDTGIVAFHVVLENLG